MKKIIAIIVVVIGILICISIGMFCHVHKTNETNNEVLKIKRDINNKEFSNAQVAFNKLVNNGYNNIQEKSQLELEIESGIYNKKYENLTPFLDNSKLEGKIDNKYAVTMDLNDAKKIAGNIIAEEYYNNYPNDKLNLKIISESHNECTIDESHQGNPIGIYRLSFDDKFATGTYEYAPTGKITPITMVFEK